MCIRPTDYNESTQIYTMLDEDNNHIFDVLLSQIPYVTLADGVTLDHRYFRVTCLFPDCGFSSTHPVSGGAAPPDIQLMASRLVDLNGCPCGLVPSTQGVDLSLAHSKLHCEQMDGLGRWQVEVNVGLPTEVVVEDNSNYVVGLGPVGEVPEGYSVFSLLARAGDIYGDLNTILTNVYTKIEGNQAVRAEAPSNGN